MQELIHDSVNNNTDSTSKTSKVANSKSFVIKSLQNLYYQLFDSILSLISIRLDRIYFPFSYLERVKRVGENYTLKVILWDDLPLLLLAFSWQVGNSLLHGVSILFLLVSFWCAYEVGYYENDLIAEKYEQQPKLSATYQQHKQMMHTWLPWLWSLLLGSVGITLLKQAQGANLLWQPKLDSTISLLNPVFNPYLSWVTFLIALRLCFWVYNHLNKPTRAWFYMILQSFRYYGFLVVTSTNLIGTSLISSQIISRSILYVIYRYSEGNSQSWPKHVPEKLLRCLILLFLLTAISFGAGNFNLWQSWQTWAVVAWCAIQGQGQIRRMLAQVKPVIEDGSNQAQPSIK